VGQTLGALLAERDATRFVGRRRELGVLRQMLDPDARVRVAHVHGPGGIGKSALLREVARAAGERGWTPRWIEGRELAPVPEALAAALAGVEEVERPLLLVDTYERISGLDGHLRRDVVPRLPAGARVVFAGRRRPDVAWSQSGWEHLAVVLALGGLEDEHGLELLDGLGLSDHDDARRILGWAGGSPLAMTMAVGAGHHGDGGGGDLGRPDDVRALVRRLTAAELDPDHLDTLAVASIARVTTPALLRAVLPGADAERELGWLGERSFAEPLGPGLALHDLVGRAVHADLGHRAPERERDLRRRIADHLHERALAGDLLLSIDLAHLLEDPVLRWGYSWEGADRYRVDDLRHADIEALGAALEEHARTRWWADLVRLLTDAPQVAAVVRDTRDRLVGFTAAVTPRTAPAAAERDPQLGPWLAHARALSPAGDVVVWHSSVSLKRGSGAHGLLGMAGILRSGLRNPRYSMLPVVRSVPGAAEFAAACGARHEPALDVGPPDARIECHVLDFGAGGVLGMQRDAVYRETGAGPPGAEGAPPRPVTLDDVREALRSLGVPTALARSPLATGTSPAERAASVRERLSRAAGEAFGDTAEERLLRSVLERGYLDPAPSHELAAGELYLSRATYFRRLREATGRIAEHLAAG
jgi:hypothetical protein